MTGEVGKTRGATTNATGVCRGQRSEERLIFALRGAIRGRLATIAVFDRLNYRRWDTNTRFNKGMGTVLSGDGRERELAAARPRRCCSRGLGEKNPVSLGYASSFYSRTRPVNSTSALTGQGQRNQYSLPRHIEDTTRRDSEDTPPQKKDHLPLKNPSAKHLDKSYGHYHSQQRDCGPHRLRSHATMGTLLDGLDNIGDSLPKKMVAPMDIKNLDPTENTNSAELYSKKKDHLHLTMGTRPQRRK